MSLATGWPTAADVALRARITIDVNKKTTYSLDVDSLLQDAYRHVCEHCGRSRTLGFDTSDVVDEMHEAGERIFVRHPPIVSVDEVLWDESELTEDEDFWIEADHIYIPLRTTTLERTHPFRRTPQLISLSYTGGYSDGEETGAIAIPRPLKEAVAEVAVIWLLKYDERYRLNRNAQKTSIGKYSATFLAQIEELAGIEKRLENWIVGM